METSTYFFSKKLFIFCLAWFFIPILVLAQPRIVFNAATSNTTETDANFTFNIPVTITTPNAAAFPMNLTIGGTATQGTDYTIAGLTAGVITIPANATTYNIVVTVIGDDIFDGNETITFEITNCNCCALPPPAPCVETGNTHTFTINDDETIPILSFTTATGAANEGNANNTVNLNVNISGASDVAITATITISNTSTAAYTTDYTTTPNATGNPRTFTVTFPAGSTTAQVIAINIVGDAVPESAETIIFTIADGANHNINANNDFTHTITNDDALPNASFTTTPNPNSGLESNNTINVTVTLSTPATQTTTVVLAYSGSANNTGADNDYNISGLANDDEVVFAVGESTKTFQLEINQDNVAEGDNEVIITILPDPLNPDRYSVGATDAYSYTILDDDVPNATFAISSSTNVEDNQNITVTINLSKARATATNVRLTFVGSANNPNDYTVLDLNASNELVIPANITTQTFRLAIKEDQTPENSETIEIEIINPTISGTYTVGALKDYIHTIQDDDAPSAYLVANGVVVTNDGETDPSNGSRPLSISTAGETVTFTALPLAPIAISYTFKWASNRFNAVTNLTPGTVINGETVIISNNTLKIKLVPGNVVRVEIITVGQTYETNNIEANSSPFENLPETTCKNDLPINFKIRDDVWSAINPSNPAPGIRFKRVEYTNFTLINNTPVQEAQINQANLIPAGGLTGTKGIYIVCANIDAGGNEVGIFDYAVQFIEIGDSIPADISSSFITAYCQNDASVINLPDFGIPSPSGSEIGIFTIQGTNPVTAFTPITSLKPTDFAPGDYRLRYEYSTSLNCRSFEFRDVVIYPAPSSEFTFTGTCLGDSLSLIASDTGSNLQYEWRINSIPFSTEQNPKIIITAAALYEIRLEVRNIITQCFTTTTKNININALPIANFTFDDICTLTPKFVNLSQMNVSNPTNNRINRLTWNFGTPANDSRIINITDPATYNIVQGDVNNFSFPDYGSYQVQLIIETTAGCSDTITKLVSIFPTVVPTNGSPYIQTFDTPDGKAGWISGGINSSWQLDVPYNRNIKKADGKVWLTKLGGLDANTPEPYFNNDERSFVESPCFDLSQIDFPMVSLKIWSDTDINSDGTVLYYTYDNDENSKWNVLSLKSAGGTPTSITGGGIAWYNKEFILGKPGDGIALASANDNQRSVGWAGKFDRDLPCQNDSCWRNARFALDAVKAAAAGRTVRFRVVFGSNGDNPATPSYDGFAFDNFVITDRKRLVLVEHFTNPNIPNYTAIEDSLTAQTAVGTNQNAIAVRYHTSFPSTANSIITKPYNKMAVSARSLHYGVESIAKSTLDGVSNTIYNKQKLDSLLSIRVLEFPVVSIDDFSLTAEGTNQIRLRAKFTQQDTTRTDVDTLVVMAGIIEYAVNGIHRNVVREFYPDASGFTRIDWKVIDKDTPYMLDIAFQPESNMEANKFGLFLFLQDELTKEIYQSISDTIRFDVDGKDAGRAESGEEIGVLTEIDDKNVSIAPNPNQGAFHILLNKKLKVEADWILFNLMGVVVGSGKMQSGDDTSLITTHNLPAGIYTLAIGNARRKVVINK